MNEKKLNIVTLVSISLAIILAILVLVFSMNTETLYTPKVMKYETELFSDEIFTVNIIADDVTWQSILDNATNEEYTAVDVEVNGVLYKNVGFRPKGNSSLTQVAQNSSTDRFSWKIKFDKYVDGQTCLGLDMLVLNNSLNDDSYVRDYLTYDLMNYMGVNSVLSNFADVTLNGENIGFYVAVEGYEESYKLRNYGHANGQLYKSDTSVVMGDMGGGGVGDRPQGNMTNGNEMPQQGNMANGNEMPQQGNIANASSDDTSNSSGGSDFLYYGSDIDEYYGLLDNSVGNTATASDKARFVKSIEVLNTGENIDEYWDVDTLVRYFAVHNTLVNLDSFSAGRNHNFYTYEYNGKVTLLPWDYNETFGGGFASSTDIVNFPIDTPITGGDMSGFAVMDIILSNDNYNALYHAYLQEVCVYLDNISEILGDVDGRISGYVENDATSFTTYSGYKSELNSLIELLQLRSQSIKGQLDGSIPSTTQGQAENPELLIQYTSSSSGSNSNARPNGNGGGMDRNNNMGNNIPNDVPSDIMNDDMLIAIQDALFEAGIDIPKDISDLSREDIMDIMTKIDVTSVQDILGNAMSNGMNNMMPMPNRDSDNGGRNTNSGYFGDTSSDLIINVLSSLVAIVLGVIFIKFYTRKNIKL